MPEDDPRPVELSRRIDELRGETREGFKGVNDRLDKVPTEKLLVVHLEKWAGELATVRDDIRDFAQSLEHHKGLSEKRHENHKAAVAAKFEAIQINIDSRFEAADKKAVTTRRYTISTAIALIGGFVGLVALILERIPQ